MKNPLKKFVINFDKKKKKDNVDNPSLFKDNCPVDDCKKAVKNPQEEKKLVINFNKKKKKVKIYNPSLSEDFYPVNDYSKSIRYTQDFKLTKKISKTAISIVTIVVASYYLTTYGPSLLQSALSYVEGKFRPDSKVEEEFNPDYDIKDDKISTDIGNINEIDKNIPKITLDEKSVLSYQLLQATMKNCYELYVGETNKKILPMFIYPTEYEDYTSITIYCKLGNDKMVKFEYEVSDEQKFNDIFYSKLIEPSDVINALNCLASDEYILDIPQVYNSINLKNCYCSAIDSIHETIEHKLDDEGNYLEEENYEFNIVSVQDNGNIIKNQVKIKKEVAKQLEGFDENNLDTLLEIYKNDNSQFIINTTELGYNAPTLILINANKDREAMNEKQEIVRISYDGPGRKMAFEYPICEK